MWPFTVIQDKVGLILYETSMGWRNSNLFRVAMDAKIGQCDSSMQNLKTFLFSLTDDWRINLMLYWLH